MNTVSTILANDGCTIPDSFANGQGGRNRETHVRMLGFLVNVTFREPVAVEHGWPGLSLRSPGLHAPTGASKTQPRPPDHLHLGEMRLKDAEVAKGKTAAWAVQHPAWPNRCSK